MNQNISVLFGVFDGIHADTVEMLLRLNLKSLIAVVLNEEEARQSLNIQPILPTQERREMLQALQCVSCVLDTTQFQTLTHFDLIQTPETPAILKYLKIDHFIKNRSQQFPISEVINNHLLLQNISKKTPLNMLKTQQPPQNILNIKQALDLCKQKKLVTTNGSFDWLHLGHIRYLKQAKEKGDILLVLVNSDQSISKRKGNSRPIFPLEARLKTLSALKCVNYVLPFFEDTPLKNLSILKPQVHIKGGSYEKEKILEEQKLLESWGGLFETLPMIGNFSSSKFLEKLYNH